MSNFVFRKSEWLDLHDVASKAEALAELNALFASLQHRAFRSEWWPIAAEIRVNRSGNEPEMKRVTSTIDPDTTCPLLMLWYNNLRIDQTKLVAETK